MTAEHLACKAKQNFQLQDRELRVVEVSDSGTLNETAIQVAGTIDAIEPVAKSKWYRWRRDGKALGAYLLDTQVHTYAFSVAANAILSFIPFVVLLYTLALSVFKSKAMLGVVDNMVNYFFPAATKQPNWLAVHLQYAAAVSSRHGVQAFSLVMILITCTGIFLPLEVALNQAWGVTKSRNYIMNQLVAFGLALWMLVLAIVIILLNEGAQGILTLVFSNNPENFFFKVLSNTWLVLSGGTGCIALFFSIYWILPNREVPWRPVLHTSVWTGIIWLASKYVFMALLPHMGLGELYGPFQVSVGLLLWAYVSGLILFAGAQFSVSRWGDQKAAS
ncbi:MAG: YihY/virulence factor BrkB family protein [Terracidiphilus sp.]